jgi:hypothetical protein
MPSKSIKHFLIPWPPSFIVTPARSSLLQLSYDSLLCEEGGGGDRASNNYEAGGQELGFQTISSPDFEQRTWCG